ncbi:DUF1156 domain-containing protein [Plasticicumulans sp.]|uniref:DUF1156 domain-containing protein n=1 Tax=Plasticicumulans sp. TaxID=2307179 RepID=UPI00392830DC
MTARLIEHWLPIAALGIESLRERTPMTPFPAPNRLHVWWARRPLVASRAAILASLLPADADRDKFMRVLGIHGDPVASRRRIDIAKRSGERFEGDAYSYQRAFGYSPTASEREWLAYEIRRSLGTAKPTILDPTAGGGSIPFESMRLGFKTFANDLNPVAVLIERQTVAAPAKFGMDVLHEFRRLAAKFIEMREERLQEFFPQEPVPDSIPTNFIWARTITCPHCDGLIPLSPNWRLAPDGTGVRLQADSASKRCTFEIVRRATEHSPGTVSGGDAQCPYPDCRRIVNGDDIKQQAQAGQMGEQLYAVVYKKRVMVKTKTGKLREKWERGYRAPRAEDDVSEQVAARLAEKMPEWEALDYVPCEYVPNDINDDRPIQYGMAEWRHLFSPRQLLIHCVGVELYRELIGHSDLKKHDLTKAAFAYLALALDKMLNYNSRMSVWMPTREVVANTFNRHDFAFCWSHAEMAPLIVGLGYDWAIEQTAKCIEELVELTRPDAGAATTGKQAGFDFSGYTPPPMTLTCKSGDALDHIADGSIDCVVMDPPYYDNVMYAELSDFFYVWLKRTAGHVYPELFLRPLTDKENEAVANPAKFKGEKGARALAGRDYQERMARIFSECRRVLKADGIMTLMFTHKATGAWDALTTGLMQAGFTIDASWPINTEAEGSLHIKEKSAANSTVLLVCRPRIAPDSDDEPQYWEDLEPRVAAAVRQRIGQFQQAGIRGVDLYLSCFGPALEEFSKHWPITRGTPRPQPEARRRRRQAELFEEAWDPYAVTPEDALDAARREVKNWRLDQLAQKRPNAELDPVTAWFVLAWDAFAAPVFPFDEALRLARATGVDLERDIVGRLAAKKNSDLVLWDASTRAAKGSLGPADGSRAMLDAIHHLAHLGRAHNIGTARERMERIGLHDEPKFLSALEAVLEVLPVSTGFGGLDVPEAAAAAAGDFDALEKLRRLALSQQIGEPEQLKMFG